MIIKKNNQKFNKKPNKNASLKTSAQKNVASKDKEKSSINKQNLNQIQQVKQEEKTQEQEIDLFDIENIDFEQRQERRRGSRRRGYRRIDDRNVVSRAQEESENIKKSAFEEGYRKGLEQSKADIDNLNHEIKKFMNAKKDVFDYIAPDIMEISIDIAKKIIKKEVETDPQILINTIIDVLKMVAKNEAKITIRIRPQVVQFVKDSLPNLTYEYGIDTKITVVADPTIEEGGCILQTNNGIVDASISTQLEIIKKAMEGI